MAGFSRRIFGIPATDPTGFLPEGLIHQVGITGCHRLDGERNPPKVIAEMTVAFGAPIDASFLGMRANNRHLAFNSLGQIFAQGGYIVVDLEEGCRGQPLGEAGWGRLDEVPRRASSVTVHNTEG